MESIGVPSFEDPALKQALRRSCGAEGASVALRDRIAGALATADDSPSVPGPRFRNDAKPTMFSFGSNAMTGLALAAMLLILVGIAAFRLSRMSSDPVPQSLAEAMVTRHDLCCGAPDHQDHSLPPVALPALATVLRGQLGHAVLAADLVKDGWTFRGISKCPVGDVRSAHFLFAKGDETISVFSLPAGSFPAVNTKHRYEGVVQNHPMICYEQDGAVFAFVGFARTGELKLADVKSLAAEHVGDMALAASPLAPKQFAELLHDDH